MLTRIRRRWRAWRNRNALTIAEALERGVVNRDPYWHVRAQGYRIAVEHQHHVEFYRNWQDFKNSRKRQYHGGTPYAMLPVAPPSHTAMPLGARLPRAAGMAPRDTADSIMLPAHDHQKPPTHKEHS